MQKKRIFYTLLDNLESYICRALLVSFVFLLFIQILARELFEYSSSWSEELATYMFVWFVFLGASYAAKLSAHNRITFQFKLFPPKVSVALEAFSDLIWLVFNIYFVYLSIYFIFFKMNLFWKSQTLGVPMKYFYLILPISFALMSFRIIQVNYYKFIKGVDADDPESLKIQKILGESTENEASKTISQLVKDNKR